MVIPGITQNQKIFLEQNFSPLSNMKVLTLIVFLSFITNIMGYVTIPGLKFINSLDFEVSKDFTEDQMGLLNHATTEWLKNGVGFKLEQATTNELPYERDGRNVIIISEDLTSADSVIYGTYLSDNSWLISEVDMRINLNNIIDRTSFYNAMLHEFGHAAGLFHSENPNSVMGSGLTMTPEMKTVESAPFEISDDDIAGIMSIRNSRPAGTPQQFQGFSTLHLGGSNQSPTLSNTNVFQNNQLLPTLPNILSNNPLQSGQTPQYNQQYNAGSFSQSPSFPGTPSFSGQPSFPNSQSFTSSFYSPFPSSSSFSSFNSPSFPSSSTTQSSQFTQAYRPQQSFAPPQNLPSNFSPFGNSYSTTFRPTYGNQNSMFRSASPSANEGDSNLNIELQWVEASPELPTSPTSPQSPQSLPSSIFEGMTPSEIRDLGNSVVENYFSRTSFPNSGTGLEANRVVDNRPLTNVNRRQSTYFRRANENDEPVYSSPTEEGHNFLNNPTYIINPDLNPLNTRTYSDMSHISEDVYIVQPPSPSISPSPSTNDSQTNSTTLESQP